jgi:hypothetical protein
MNRDRCHWCGQPLDDRDRRDRRTCSTTCRVALWRSGKARGAEGDIELHDAQVSAPHHRGEPCSRYIGSVGPTALALPRDGGSPA